MVSFVGKTHMMVLERKAATRLNHFATAFFGTYLQGRSDYLDHISEMFVLQFDDLAWECMRVSDLWQARSAAGGT
jgi:hypothetical protein